MDMEQFIDLTTDSYDETTSVVRTINKTTTTMNIDNNLDVHDYFAETTQTDSHTLTGETTNIGTIPNVGPVNVEQNETRHTNTKVPGPSVRFVPNKKLKKRGNEEKRREMQLDDQRETKQPKLDTKRGRIFRHDLYHQRMRANDNNHHQPQSVGSGNIEMPASYQNDKQEYKRDFYNNNRHDTTTANSNGDCHASSNERIERGKRNEHKRYLSEKQPFIDSRRMDSEYVHQLERARNDREVVSCRLRDIDEMKYHLEEKLRSIDTQRVTLETREKDVMAKEIELLRSRLEWEEQKALKRDEIEEIKEKLNVDRLEHDRCMNEFERRRTQLEQELDSQRIALEVRLDGLQVEYENKRLELENQIKKKQGVLNEHASNQRIQQEKLSARLKECVARENSVAELTVTQKIKATELSAQETQLRKRQLVLTEKDNKQSIEKATHQKNVDLWTKNIATERANLNKQIVGFNSFMHSTTTELREKEIELSKKRTELDARAVAQRRRTMELKAMKREIDAFKNVETRKSAPTNITGSEGANTEPIDLRTGKPIDYILIDSDDDDNNAGKDQKAAAAANNSTRSEKTRNPVPPQQERTKESYKFNGDEYYNYSYTEESAYELQERLLRKAAEKMHSRPNAEIARNNPVNNTTTFTIATPIIDIAVRFPHHWTWKDPYAVLGLPPNSTIQLVKSQYRRLARIYHPDKSTDSHTSAKFHSISSAYHKLAENS